LLTKFYELESPALLELFERTGIILSTKKCEDIKKGKSQILDFNNKEFLNLIAKLSEPKDSFNNIISIAKTSREKVLCYFILRK